MLTGTCRIRVWTSKTISNSYSSSQPQQLPSWPNNRSMCTKSFFHLLLLFFLATPLVGQTNYFARAYTSHTGQLATEVFFHPQGGYSVVFGSLSGNRATTLHRMDAAGNIGLSYSSTNSVFPHFNIDLDTAGNHWLVGEPLQVINSSNSTNFDSVRVTYLDDSLQLIWEADFDIGLSGSYNFV